MRKEMFRRNENSFLFGIFWKRVNGKGAITSLLTGLFLGGIRLILEVQNKISPLSNDFLRYVASVNFLHYAIFLFVVCSIVLVAVSLATEVPAGKRLEKLVISADSIHYKADIKWRRINIAASVILVALLIFLWWTFR